jgi:transposase
VIDVATLSVIRRWALREQMSIREIARRTGLSRNTVKKYLRAGDEAPRYAKRASSSKLDPYADKLATWLAIEATKSRKQRRNLRQIHTFRTDGCCRCSFNLEPCVLVSQRLSAT